jgi:hypothetical protein
MNDDETIKTLQDFLKFILSRPACSVFLKIADKEN